MQSMKKRRDCSRALQTINQHFVPVVAAHRELAISHFPQAESTPPLWRGDGDACPTAQYFFSPLTQRVPPLLEKVEKGLAHLRLGPVARHACKSLGLSSWLESKARGCKSAKAEAKTKAKARVQMRCFGEQSAGLWRVGFVETSTRVTQAYKGRLSPASGRAAAP